jgi:hypothetical protein
MLRYCKHEKIIRIEVANMNTAFLATDALYKTLDDQAFNQEKSLFLQAWYSKHTRNIEDKWDALTRAFHQEIQATLPDHHHDFENFMNKCKASVTDNVHVLSPLQYLDYFERFYFLHQNISPIFQLSPAMKKKLLLSMTYFMQPNICNIGLVRRFEEILEEFQADKNWIEKDLYDHRNFKLKELVDRYNTDFHVSDGMSVHTLDVMRYVATQKQLGFFQRQDVKDAYNGQAYVQKVQSFFEKHYQKVFADYERSCLLHLSQSVLVSMIKDLKHHNIDLSSWDSEPVLLPSGYRLAYGRVESLQNDQIYIFMVADKLACSIEKEIFYLDHDKNAVSPEMQATLARLKTVLNQTDVSIINNVSSDDEKNLWVLLASHHALGECAFIQTFCQNLSKKLFFQGEISVLMNEIIEINNDAYYLKPNPQCLRFISYYLHDLMIKQGLIVSVESVCEEQCLDTWRLSGSVSREEVQQCLTMLKDHSHVEEIACPHVLAEYPAIFFYHAKNNLDLFRKLPQSLKRNADFMQQVAAFFYTQFEIYQHDDETQFHKLIACCAQTLQDSAYVAIDIPAPWKIFDLAILCAQHQSLKMDAVTRLTQDEAINLYDLAQLTHYVTAQELSDILIAREQQQRASLPYCQDDEMYHAFLSTHAASSSQFSLLDYMRYYENKRILELSREKIEHAVNNNIFPLLLLKEVFLMPLILAMISDLMRGIYPCDTDYGGRYDRDLQRKIHFLFPNSVYDVRSKCYHNMTIDTYRDTAWQQYQVQCDQRYVHWVHDHPILSRLTIVGYIENLTLIGASDKLMNEWLYHSPILNSVFLFLHVLLIVLMCFAMTSSGQKKIPSLWLKLNKLCSKTPDFLLSSDLRTQCDIAILRLQGCNALSAHQKADLLNQILQQIKQEHPVIVDAHLKKTYTIHYKNTSYQKSFLQISDIPRTNEDEFSIDSTSHQWHLCRTTTRNLLSKSLFQNSEQMEETDEERVGLLARSIQQV